MLVEVMLDDGFLDRAFQGAGAAELVANFGWIPGSANGKVKTRHLHTQCSAGGHLRPGMSDKRLATSSIYRINLLTMTKKKWIFLRTYIFFFSQEVEDFSSRRRNLNKALTHLKELISNVFFLLKPRFCPHHRVHKTVYFLP
jgi:hypothetical protein